MISRPVLVAATAALALVVFAAAAVFYNRSLEQEAGSAPSAEESLLVRAYSPVIGPKDAPVTIVEFFDPACEACRAFHPIVKQILAAYPGEVRVVLRYAAFHKGSDEAVRILETARLQGSFEPVLEALLATQPVWASHSAPDIGKAWEAAGAVGLDLTRARRDMLMPDITAALNQDTADVHAAGVKQTPTFFVNGKPLPSFGAQQLYDLVSSEVAAARRSAGG